MSIGSHLGVKLLTFCLYSCQVQQKVFDDEPVARKLCLKAFLGLGHIRRVESRRGRFGISVS
jgi:hypothetical protein